MPGAGSSPRFATGDSICRTVRWPGTDSRACSTAPGSPTMPMSTVAAISDRSAAGTSSGPIIAAHGPSRWARCARTASGSGRLPGGKTAASSTRAASRGGTAFDTASESNGRYTGRTTSSAIRTDLSSGRQRMPYYRRVGEVPPKRHTQFRQPDGSLFAEELMGQEGFSSDSSLLYHKHRPTAILSATAVTPFATTRAGNLPLKPRHFQTHKLGGGPTDAVLGRQHLLANDDVRMSYAIATTPSPLYRNAIGDECLYV